MKAYATKNFQRWATQNKINSMSLTQCLQDIESGNVDANLGSGLYKQRVSIAGQGKSGSSRIILAMRIRDKAFFLYGFNKNSQENLTKKELKAYKIIAKQFLKLTNDQIEQYLKEKVLFKIGSKGK